MYLPPFLDLRAGFAKYFSVVPATTDPLRDEVYRIRHDVYCRELGYEPIRDDGREIDAYDAHSIHCLLRANESGRFVGCIRLVQPDPAAPNEPLPFEKTCAATIDRTIVDPMTMPRDKIAEVSRLAVISAYRRRKTDHGAGGDVAKDDFGSEKQPRFPYIPAGLYLGMIAQAQQAGIETLFVLTEPRLARHLMLLGVRVKRIGTAVEHRGRRVPSMLEVPGIVAGFGPVVRPFYAHVSAAVAAGPEASTGKSTPAMDETVSFLPGSVAPSGSC